MEYLLQILLALAFGGVLGAERGHAGKAAGLRTYMLVTLAATTFTIISQESQALSGAAYDPGRIISQVILGIGFIGGGIIVYQREQIHGMTTAAGLWIATAIGIAIGVKLYILATAVTIVTVIIMGFLIPLEDKLQGKD